MHLIFAPIHGITTALFRRIFIKYFPGFDEIYAPFIPLARCRKNNSSHLADIHPNNNHLPIPLIPQLLGKDPEQFISLANLISSLGYPLINWNLGCPAPSVMRKKHGSGLLAYPNRIEQILDEIMPKLTCSLSIKMRLGSADPDEIFKILPVLNHYPLVQVVIHPRTGSQLYRGTVDLQRFRMAVTLSRIPVSYNGDITTVHHLHALQQTLPAIGSWMIGRGSLSDPFLAGTIKGITRSTSEKRRLLSEFHQELLGSHFGQHGSEHCVLGFLKQFWHYFAEGFHCREELRTQLMRASTVEAFNMMAKTAFETLYGNNE
ncbi:MAG: tRNA-dihydrouridine synthase family protein [Chitinivibrionales bacterium]|nr:tRNA-dihydrouridine synthase family protein [Chitinivibrionales bacterium]